MYIILNLKKKKKKKWSKSFKLVEGKGMSQRSIVTDGTHLFISDKANESILKYTLNMSMQQIRSLWVVVALQLMKSVYILEIAHSLIMLLTTSLEIQYFRHQKLIWITDICTEHACTCRFSWRI